MGLSESRLAWPLVVQLRRETALDRDRLQHLAAAFDRAAADDDALSRDGLAAALRALGLAGDDRAIGDLATSLFDMFDADGVGRVDYKHFVVALSVFASRDVLDSNLDLVFGLYNTAGNERITREEMVTVLTTLGKTLALARFRPTDAGDVEHGDVAADVITFVDGLFASFHLPPGAALTREQFGRAVREHPLLTAAPADVFAALIGKAQE